MGRAPCCDKANVKKGPWSPEEDAELKAYIDKHGTAGNWIALPQKIGLKRCGKSCRLRWLNYLRPNIKHGGFSEEEDDIICSLYLSIGSRWSIIAAHLPGRTDNDIKNYWNTRLKKKMAGKQRKEEQQARRGSSSLKQEMKREYCETNFMVSEAMNQFLYWPELPVAPVAATNSSQEDHLRELLVSLGGGGRFLEDHQQPNMYINGKNNQYPFEIFPTQDQLYDNSYDAFPSSTSMNSRSSPYNSQLPNMFPGFQEYPIEAGETPLKLDGLETFSAVDMVNGSSGTGTSSAESISWGDVNSFVYPPMASINYEACRKRAPTSCMFEESRSGF